jgi:hypothetical protein
LLDKEEFQAWKDSPATRWVLERYQQEISELAQRAGENLFNSPVVQPAEWAANQVQIAYSKGYFDGLSRSIAGEYESLLTEEEFAELKEAEKAKE